MGIESATLAGSLAAAVLGYDPFEVEGISQIRAKDVDITGVADSSDAINEAAVL